MKNNKQTKFSKLYIGELKKGFNPILIVVILLLFVAISLISYSFINITKNNVGPFEAAGPPSMELPVISSNPYQQTLAVLYQNASKTDGSFVFKNKADIDAFLATVDGELSRIKAEQKKQGIKFFSFNRKDPYYEVKAQRNMFKYIKNNAMGTQIRLSDNAVTSAGYVKFAFSLGLGIIAFYGVIVASSIYSKEFKSGSIKMLMIRPITRNKLTSAKLLATLTHSTAMFSVATLFVLLVGFSAFKQPSYNMLFSFNNGAYSIGPAGMSILFEMMTSFLSITFWTITCFSVAALTKNLVAGILTYAILPMLSLPLSFIGLDLVFISNVFNWSSFIGETVPGPIGSNFFISFAMTIIYVGGLLGACYYVVNKRDLA